MINKSEAIKKILWASIEDYVGVWELPWELSSLSDSKAEKFATSKEIVELLLKKNLIRIHSCKEPYGDIKELSKLEDELAVLNDKNTWEIPIENQIGFRVGATKKGEELYNSNRFEELENL